MAPLFDPPWRLDPFQNIVNVGWTSQMFVVIHGFGLIHELNQSGASRNGEHGFQITPTPDGEDVPAIDDVDLQDNGPGTTFHLRKLLTVEAKLPFSFEIDIGGQWFVQDIPGLPVVNPDPTQIEVFLFDGSHEVDLSNTTYGLIKKDGTPASPMSQANTQGVPIIDHPGHVDFGSATITIEIDPKRVTAVYHP